jgi:hypothetical protein
MRIGDFGENMINCPTIFEIAYENGYVIVRVAAGVTSGSRAKQNDPRDLSRKSRMYFSLECTQMVSRFAGQYAFQIS